MLSILICIVASYTFALEEKYHPVAKNIIEAFRTLDKGSLANNIAYPLTRQYPIPSINDRNEFLKRFDEIFDEDFIQFVVSSDINDDWMSVGWRGIMLANGLMWANYDGKIRAINYQSEAERAIREKLINKDKEGLHPSIQGFSEPVLEWETENFRIRIDDMGDHNYRYSSWDIKKSIKDKPDLILKNGDVVFEGSGGNHY